MGLRGAPPHLETLFRYALLALLALSLGLLGAALIVYGPMPAPFTEISNAVQLVASMAAAGAAAWAYYRRKPDLLLAHGAFAGATWTLANAFWYAYYILIGQELVYPTVADLGFAGVFLFLIASYQEGRPRNRLPWYVAAPIAVPLLAYGIWLVLALGADGKTLTTLVIFALAAALLSTALLRLTPRYPALIAGTVAFALAHLFNSVDFTLPEAPELVGTGMAGALAALAFSLFGLAYLGYTGEAGAIPVETGEAYAVDMGDDP